MTAYSAVKFLIILMLLLCAGCAFAQAAIGLSGDLSENDGKCAAAGVAALK